MSKPATSDNSSAVGLFPFLAVLLCTMGALLVLLVILAQRIGVDPLTAIVDPTSDSEIAVQSLVDPNEVAQLEAELAEIEAYQQKLDQLEEEGQKRLDDERVRLSHLEEHIRRMEHELGKLALSVEQLKATEEDQAIDQEQAKRELDRLQVLIEDTEDQLEDMREMAGGERSYAVVPFKGKNGTYAQPVYIVCDENGITLKPEGLRFQHTDFVDPKWPGNPLAAALRASREYLKEKARRTGNPEPLDPYPLIIVRPDGIKHYRVAREAISSWDASYGYEFIDEDWKLTYPELPDPKLAEVQQHAVMIARERLQRLAMAAPSKFRGIAGVGGRSGGTGESRNGYGTAANGRYSSGTSNTNAAGVGTGEGYLASSAAGDEGFGGGTSGGLGAERAFSSIGPYGGAPSATGEGGGGGANGTGDLQSNGADPSSPDVLSGSQGAGNSSGNNYPGDSQTAATGGNAGAGQPGQPGGTAGASQGSGQTGGQAGSASGSPGTSGSAGQQASSAAQGGANPQQADTQPGMPTFQFTKQQSIADARGSDWAIKQAMNNAVPIRRPIQVVVRENQIALLPSRHTRRGAGATGTVILLNQPLQKISDEFAGALKERIQEWGLAGNGLYWRPVLELRVGPEAQHTADRLVRLLKNSGVDVRLPETANLQRGQGAYESK